MCVMCLFNIIIIIIIMEPEGIGDGVTTCVASMFCQISKQLENSPSRLRMVESQVQKGPLIGEGIGRKTAFPAKDVPEDHLMQDDLQGCGQG